MATIGRNAPCPCGSTKKYKKCCLPRQQPPAAPSIATGERVEPMVWVEEDGLEELSNRVVDLVGEGRLDEAEAACQELKARFPQMPDWMERMGLAQETRGNYEQAAQYYRQAADFIEGKPAWYDPEFGEWLRQEAGKMEAKATSNPAGKG